MYVYPLFWNPIVEENDLVKVYVDPIIAEEQCKAMNELYVKNNSGPLITKYPYTVGAMVEVVE